MRVAALLHESEVDQHGGAVPAQEDVAGTLDFAAPDETEEGEVLAQIAVAEACFGGGRRVVRPGDRTESRHLGGGALAERAAQYLRRATRCYGKASFTLKNLCAKLMDD